MALCLVRSATRGPLGSQIPCHICRRVAGTHCCVPAPSEPCVRLGTAHGSSKPLTFPDTPLRSQGLEMTVEVHKTLIVDCALTSKSSRLDVMNAQSLVVVQALAAMEAEPTLLFGECLLRARKLRMPTRSSIRPIILKRGVIG